ncbi:MAG: hypothetical protein ABI723_23845 [Bacteroidia bacterium]
MKYFIYKHNKLTEVSEQDYELWALYEMENYVLPEYLAIINSCVYSIETIYQGVIDEQGSGKPRPFVMFYSEYVIQLGNEGVKYLNNKESMEFFETIEALVTRRNELIRITQAKA